MLDVRVDHGPQRVVLQVRQLRDNVRLCLTLSDTAGTGNRDRQQGQATGTGNRDRQMRASGCAQTVAYPLVRGSARCTAGS